jgi:hypothetical protein
VVGDAGKASLRVAVDADGCVGVHVEPTTVSLVISQRVGLSARALERLRREASERARVAAARHRNEELRRRVWTLARTVEAWLGERDDKPMIDELLQTSLTQWRRDAEVALERGDDELLAAGLDSFAALREALPAKLRPQVEDETLRLGGPGEDPAAELEPLGDPSTDYDANERVDPIEPEDLEPSEIEIEPESEHEPESAVGAAPAEDVAVEEQVVARDDVATELPITIDDEPRETSTKVDESESAAE